MATQELFCAVCAAGNPLGTQRCQSCGARIETYALELTAEEERARENQQEGFEWRWVFVALATYVVLESLVLGLLPLLVSSYDPQGLAGLLIASAIWFVGAMAVGAVSPGRTFIEPAVGALLAVPPTIAYLMSIADVYSLSLVANLVMCILGVMTTLFGALLGERLQLRFTPPKRAR